MYHNGVSEKKKTYVVSSWKCVVINSYIFLQNQKKFSDHFNSSDKQ